MTETPASNNEPDIFGLVDVMSLIAPNGVARGTTALVGGLATAMHVVDVDLESGAQVAFVLRRFVHHSFTPRDAVREAATLEALRPLPIPAPELLWLDGDGRVFARPALAMTRLPGQSAITLLDDEPATVIERLLDALTTVAWVPPAAVDHLPRLARADDLLAWFEVGSAAFEAETIGPPGLRERLVAMLSDAAVQPAILVHGDLHANNLLVDGGQLGGLVDWDRAAVGDPRIDIAHAAVSLGLVAGLDAGRALLAGHLARGADHTDLDAFILLALCRALPDPAAWLPAWTAHGVAITAAQVTDRWSAMLDTWT